MIEKAADLLSNNKVIWDDVFGADEDALREYMRSLLYVINGTDSEADDHFNEIERECKSSSSEDVVSRYTENYQVKHYFGED